MNFFRVYIASSKQEGELREFETVTQTLDCVSGLHNCLELSQVPVVFKIGYVNTEEVLYCLIALNAESFLADDYAGANNV